MREMPAAWEHERLLGAGLGAVGGVEADHQAAILVRGS
jgi:hypothetical protein